MFLRSTHFLERWKYLCFATTRRNPYDVLKVRPKATQEQIKKAYRVIAQKYHPDKNPDQRAQELFVEAKEAYETLADEDRRRQYDNESNERNGHSRSYGFDKDPFDEFNQDIYKDKSRVYNETYTAGSSRRKRGEDIKKQVKIDFVQAIKGAKIGLELERRDACATCHGNRCQPGTAPSRCLACGGSGSTIYRQSSIVMHLECTRCKGIGIIIKNPCTDCKAAGIKVLKVTEQIEIPAGIDSGEHITLRQKGNQSENGPSGDLHVKFIIEKHPLFRKNGKNVESTEWITISQATLGTKKVVSTVWGPQELNVPAGTQDGMALIIPGYGVKRTLESGDHNCIIRISIPSKLSDRQRQIFQQLAQEEEEAPKNSAAAEQTSSAKTQNSSSYDKFRDYFR